MRRRPRLLGVGVLALLGLPFASPGLLPSGAGEPSPGKATSPAARGRPITKATCDRIRDGMTRKQVETFLARPADFTSPIRLLVQGENGRKLDLHLDAAVWRAKGAEIEVWFLPSPGGASTVYDAFFREAKGKAKGRGRN